MKTFVAFLRAFGRAYTYDIRKNSYLWLGVFWGLLVPFFTIALDVRLLSPEGRGPFDVFHIHPKHFVLLAHPLLLGVLFGAMGTVRHDLEAENKLLVQTLGELAMTDPLTGLYNRRYVEEALKNMLETARRWHKPLSVVLIDLDGFKEVNEEYGHPQGDRVLCAAATALKSSLRQSDVLGRHGGDEFILLNAGDPSSAASLLGRAVDAVKQATGLSLSAGIACWPEDGENSDELIAAADERLGIFKKRSHESRDRLRAVPADPPLADAGKFVRRHPLARPLLSHPASWISGSFISSFPVPRPVSGGDPIMSQLSREEYVELGVSVPTEPLIGWAQRQLAATKGRETRLQSRGLNGAYLTGVGDLIAKIQNRQREAGDQNASPPEAAGLAQRIREEALEYWREAKQMAEVAFGADPELLAKFRTGVQTRLLIANLTRELESMIGLFREHSLELAELGGTEAFIERGVFLVGRLKEVKGGLDAACRGFSPEAAQQWHDKGLLYDLTRKLVRVGRLEFRLDPEQAAAFNFNGVKGKRDASARSGLKRRRIGGHDPA